MQHALDGSAPDCLTRVYLDQLAHKRQSCVRQPERPSDHRAQAEHLCGNIRRLAPQRFHFFRGHQKLPLLLRLLVDQRELLLLAIDALFLPCLHFLPRLRRHFGKPVRRFRRHPAELPATGFHLRPLAQTFVSTPLQPGLLRLQAFDAVASLFAMLPLQVVQHCPLVFERGLALLCVRQRAREFDAQCRDPLLQQGQPAGLLVTIHSRFHFLEPILLQNQVLKLAMAVASRRQRAHLLACRHNGLVRGIQFGELAHQPLRRIESLRPVEHEVAQEGVEVAQILRRLRLVEQPQSLLAFDAKQPAETLTVGLEVLPRECLGKRLLQLAYIQIEILDLPQVERPLEDQVVTLDIGIAVRTSAQPKQLNQYHHPALRVAVGERQRGPSGAGAQILHGDLARLVVLLLRPRAAHVADQVAIPPGAGRFARGRVEINPSRRHQQRRDGIQQGRLSGARWTDEEKAALGDGNIVQTREGSPVEHLQTAHPELIGVEQRTERWRGGLHRPASSSVSGSGAGVTASPSAML